MSTTRRPIRVLIVDDDPNALSALGALLREPDREVVLAHDGIDALVKLASFHPDVNDAVARLPIVMPRFVFMSAMAQPDVEGNVHFVSKPIAIDRLTTLVDEAAHAMHGRAS
jgi:two-component SAPR family response regulator